MRRLVCWLLGHDYIPHVDARGRITHWCLRCGEGWPR